MRSDQIEDQLARRLKREFRHRDVVIRPTSVRVSSSDSVSGRLQNFVRRYPLGSVVVEVVLEGPDVEPGEPWDAGAFRRLCDEAGVAPTYHEKPDESVREGDVVVELAFASTRPEVVTNFVQRLPEAVAGELEDVEDVVAA